MTSNIQMDAIPGAGGFMVVGMDPDQVNLLTYVVEMLQHGMSPRIINVTPDLMRQEMERAVGDEDLTDPLGLRDSDEALWELAKRADQEVENNHHFLDSVTEDLEGSAYDVACIALEVSADV